MSTPIGDPRPAGQSGPAGDQRPAGQHGTAGDPRPAGEASVATNDANNKRASTRRTRKSDD